MKHRRTYRTPHDLMVEVGYGSVLFLVVGAVWGLGRLVGAW